jgi:hypothetical protein
MVTYQVEDVRCGNVPIPFRIEARLMDGTPKGFGGDKFSLVMVPALRSNIASDEELVADVTDHGDGTYTLTVVAHTAGLYDARVFLEGNKPLERPFLVDMEVPHGIVHPPACSVDGEGLLGAELGQQASFTIHCRDCFKNTVYNRGLEDDPKVTVSGPQRVVPAHLSDNGDGSITAVYSTTVSGAYHISVMFRGRHVAGSQFRATVVAGFEASEVKKLQTRMEEDEGATVERGSLSGGRRLQQPSRSSEIMVNRSGRAKSPVSANGGQQW